MPAVDYHGIVTTLKTLLEADSSLAGVQVLVEQEPVFDVLGSGKAIVLTLDSRNAPGGQQPISQGKRTRWMVRIAIWAIGFDTVFEEACRKRDDLMGTLELALMNNRTVSDKLAHSFLDGGAFIPVQDARGMYALGETVLVGEATAVAT